MNVSKISILIFIFSLGIFIGALVNFVSAQIKAEDPITTAKTQFQYKLPVIGIEKEYKETTYSIDELILIELKSINSSIRQIEKQTK